MAEISKIIPVQQIENDFAIGRAAEVTAGWKLILPEVFSVDTAQANVMYENLIGIIKALPKFTVVHFQHFFVENRYKSDYTNVDVWTKQMDLNMFDGRPVMIHYCNLYISFMDSDKKSVSKNLDTAIKNFPRYKNICDTLQNDLNSSKFFKAVRMDGDDLIKSMHDYLNQSYDSEKEVLKSKFVQPWTLDESFVKVGQKYVNCISLIEEGDILTIKKKANAIDAKQAFGDKVNEYSNDFNTSFCLPYTVGIGLPFNHIYNVIIQVLDSETIGQQIRKGYTGLSFLEVFKVGASLEKKKSINTFLEEIEQLNFKGAKVSVNVIVYDTDKEKLQRKIGYARAGFRYMNGSESFSETYDNLNVFLSSFPGNGNTNKRTLFSTVEMAAFYFHYETHYRSTRKGFLFSDRFGNPYNIDIRNAPGKTNNNGVIFGPSGTGKSFTSQSFIDNCLNNGEQVVLINVKPDYIHSAKLNGGVYIDTNNIQEQGINPFICNKDNFGKYICDIDQVDILMQLIEDCWLDNNKELEQTQKAILEKYIVLFYEDVNKKGAIPYFKDFYDFSIVFESSLSENDKAFFNFSAFRLVMEKFASGSLSFVFNTNRILDIPNDKYVVFDFYGIINNPLLFKIYLNYTTHIASLKIARNKEKGLFTNLIIDEAVDSMVGKGAKFIGAQYRKIRSLGGGIIIITQGVKYLEGMDPLVRESIFSNSQIRIILDHKNDQGSYEALAKYCSLSDQDMELLRDLKSGRGYREILVVLSDQYSKIVRVEASEETVYAYNTDNTVVKQVEREYARVESDLKLFSQSYEEKLNMVRAIKNIINSKRLSE